MGLRLHKQRLLQLLFLVVVLILPTVVVAVNKVLTIETTNATDYPYINNGSYVSTFALSSGFTDRPFNDCVSYNYETEYNVDLRGGALTDAQLAKVHGNGGLLRCGYVSLIKNTSGIQKLKGITDFEFDGSQITSIDISAVTWMLSLDISNTAVSSLNITQNARLNSLSIDRTSISYLDISNNGNLEWISRTQNLVVDPKAPVTKNSDNSYTFNLNKWVKLFSHSETDNIPDCDIPDGPNGNYNCFYNNGLKLTIKDLDATRGYIPVDTSVLSQSQYKIKVADERKLTFNLNGGSGNISTQNCFYANGYNCVIKIQNDQPEKNDSQFLGWAESLEMANNKQVSYNAGDEITMVGGKTLYAVWHEGPPMQTISFNDNNEGIAMNGVNKVYGDPKFAYTAETDGDGVITYSSSNDNVAEVDADTGEVTIKNAGESVITATASGTENYSESYASYNVIVNKAERTLVFSDNIETVNKAFGDSDFVINAIKNGDDDSEISYTITSGNNVATVDAMTGKVTITGVGTATVTASIPATNNYTAASDAYTLIVDKATQSLLFANATITKSYGDDSFINPITSVNPGQITYSSSDENVATVDSNTGEVTIIRASDTPIIITASAGATTEYTDASNNYTLIINKKTSSTPAEVNEVKTGYVTDKLSTISLSTPNMSWEDSDTTIQEGYHKYSVNYTENNDTVNYTTETLNITVNGIRRKYVTIEGDGQTYILDTDDYTSFRFDADYSLFEQGGEVLIDDAILSPKYYTSESGSSIINISNNYLKTLSLGEHSLAVHFNDGGIATASFTIQEQYIDSDDIAVPNTGVGISSGIIISIVAPVMFIIITIFFIIVHVRLNHAKYHQKFD